MAKKVKFVQIVTGVVSWPMHGYGLLGQPAPSTSASWSNLFALDDEGRVWMWTGGGAVGWVQAGPQPESGEQPTP